MIKLYNNDYEGLVQYFDDKWTNRKVIGTYLLESNGLDNLHNGVLINKGEFNTAEQIVQIANMGEGTIEVYPVSLVIQKQTQLATLTVTKRIYHSKFDIVNRLEKTFFENLLKKPAQFRKYGLGRLPHSYKCENLIEVTEKIDLESFSQDFRILEEWVLSKVKAICEEDILKMFSGDVWLESERIYESYVKINPENKAFSVELK